MFLFQYKQTPMVAVNQESDVSAQLPYAKGNVAADNAQLKKAVNRLGNDIEKLSIASSGLSEDKLNMMKKLLSTEEGTKALAAIIAIKTAADRASLSFAAVETQLENAQKTPVNKDNLKPSIATGFMK